MLKLVVSLCFIAMCGAQSIQLSSVSPKFEMVPSAVMGEIYDCGVARLIDVRISDCAVAPCRLSAGSQHTLEVVFSPRDQHWDLRTRSIFLRGTQQQAEVFDGPIPDSTVNPGQQYTFRQAFTVPQGSGISYLRTKAYQNYVLELCMSIPINIV